MDENEIIEQNTGTEENAAKTAHVIGEEQIKKAQERFEKYKAGKTNLDEKIIANEQYWKLRNWEGGNTKHGFLMLFFQNTRT